VISVDLLGDAVSFVVVRILLVFHGRVSLVWMERFSEVFFFFFFYFRCMRERVEDIKGDFFSAGEFVYRFRLHTVHLVCLVCGRY